MEIEATTTQAGTRIEENALLMAVEFVPNGKRYYYWYPRQLDVAPGDKVFVFVPENGEQKRYEVLVRKAGMSYKEACARSNRNTFKCIRSHFKMPSRRLSYIEPASTNQITGKKITGAIIDDVLDTSALARGVDMHRAVEDTLKPDFSAMELRVIAGMKCGGFEFSKQAMASVGMAAAKKQFPGCAIQMTEEGGHLLFKPVTATVATPPAKASPDHYNLQADVYRQFFELGKAERFQGLHPALGAGYGRASPTARPLRPSALPQWPCPAKENPVSIKVETKTFVNGTDVKTLTTDQLYGYIATAENEIKKLEGLKNKPRKLQERIDELQNGIDKLIEAVDGPAPVTGEAQQSDAAVED